jgi:hypothetical protein
VARTTTFLAAESGATDATILIAGNTGGADLIVLGTDTEAPFSAAVSAQLTPRPNCPGQFVAAPGELFGIDVEFAPNTSNPVARALTIETNDPDEPLLAVTVEGNRPVPATGATAPDFSVLTLAGDRYRLSDHLGDVVLIKLFNFG